MKRKGIYRRLAVGAFPLFVGAGGLFACGKGGEGACGDADRGRLSWGGGLAGCERLALR